MKTRVNASLVSKRVLESRNRHQKKIQFAEESSYTLIFSTVTVVEFLAKQDGKKNLDF